MFLKLKNKVIYKITYLNGIFYIGNDLTDSINYFEIGESKVVEVDFSIEERNDFNIGKQVLFRTDILSVNEIYFNEVEFILKFESNYPDIGFN